MTNDEQERLHQRIDEMIAAPLAVVTGAIEDLESLRSQLQAELAAHRDHRPMSPLVGRRSDDTDRTPYRRPHDPLPPSDDAMRQWPTAESLREPIGINRQAFRS